MTVRSLRRSVAAVAAGALAGTVLLALPADAAPPSDEQLAEFTKGVKLKNLLKHLEHLQQASDRNGGNRASGLPGYDASVDYVVEKLTEVGYMPVVQEFDFVYTEENSELERIAPNPTTYVEGTDFLRNRFDSGV
ncbi:MAG TPA: hypothetical protein VFH02_13820, partial [Jiangellaceae bacterium]|nr:hypothetical protein [Jiangellaceae bacterium]